MTYSGITSGSRDFNPDPTPAYSDRLRDLHNSLEKGIERRNRSVNANDRARELNAAQAGDNMAALGKLSGTLGSLLEDVQRQRIKRFQTEATVLNELDIDTQEKLDAARAKQDELEAELEESSKATDKIASKAEENDERMSIVQGIRRLNGYHIAELKKAGIIQAVDDFNSSFGESSAAYFAENDLTHEEKKAYTKSQFADFLNGLGDNYSTSLIAKYAIPAYTKAKNNEIKLLEDANDQDQSATVVRDATAKLYAPGGSVSQFVREASHTKDSQGNYLGRAGALDLLEKTFKEQAEAGNVLGIDALGDEIINGKPFREHPRFKKLKAARDTIQATNYQRDKDLEAIAIQQREDFFDQEVARLEEGARFSPAQIAKMKKDAYQDTGIPGHLFTFFDDYLTRTQQRDDKADEDILLEKLSRSTGRGYLIQSDLANVSPALAARYQVKVDSARASGLSAPPSDIVKASKGHISSMANAITNEAVGVDDVGSTDYQTVIRNVQLEYERLYQGNIMEGANPSQAHDLARQTQLDQLKTIREQMTDKDGNKLGYTRSQLYHDIGYGNDVEVDHRRKQQVIDGKNYLKNKNFDKNKTVIPGTESYLKELESYNNGTGEIPDYYFDVTRGLKNITAWDLANSQYFAHTGKKLGKDSRREAYEKAEPALQRVLTQPFNTRSRIFRSQSTIDYNSPALTNSPLSTSMRRKSDIVGKYESDSVGGYNAVNQIGVDGGHSTGDGFSGDIRKMSQHGGRALTDMTIGEIIDLQAELDVTDAQWISQGRLHAVGRYQFTRDTFRELISTLGFSRSRKFNEATQDQMFASLWKSGGPGRWVGLKHATPEELAELNS